jgi:tRNA threonylcarbamoyladenosine biosynthesis protein TsaB
VLVAAIDSATPTLSLALCEVDGAEVRVLAERTEDAGSAGHGARLPAALLELLAARELAPPAVGAWICGLGPGSFTGLRIGLATWKGFAYALRRPLAGASSLAAMALAAAAPVGAILVPLLDAKKGEVYAGFYRVAAGGGLEPALPDAALAPPEVASRAAQLGPGAIVFGQGRAAHPAAFEGLAAPAGAPLTPSAAALARLCAPALARATYDAAQVFALEPHYARKSEAEVKFPHGLPPR